MASGERGSQNGGSRKGGGQKGGGGRSGKKAARTRSGGAEAPSRKASRKGAGRAAASKTGGAAAGGASRSADAGGTRLEDARARMYRDLVFESAEYLFGAKGYEHATMHEVASEAGISLKTVYAAFPGKRELYEEIQRVRGEAFVERVAEATRAGEDARDRLERMIGAYVDFLLDHEDWLRIHLQERLNWGLGPREGFAVAYWQRGIDTLAELLARGVEEGAFYEGDTRTMAMMAMSLMQVQVAQHLGANAVPRDEVVTEITIALERLLCPGPGALA